MACNDGELCARRICFFAHCAEELRDPRAEVAASEAMAAQRTAAYHAAVAAADAENFMLADPTTPLSAGDSASASPRLDLEQRMAAAAAWAAHAPPQPPPPPDGSPPAEAAALQPAPPPDGAPPPQPSTPRPVTAVQAALPKGPAFPIRLSAHPTRVLPPDAAPMVRHNSLAILGVSDCSNESDSTPASLKSDNSISAATENPGEPICNT